MIIDNLYTVVALVCVCVCVCVCVRARVRAWVRGSACVCVSRGVSVGVLMYFIDVHDAPIAVVFLDKSGAS